MRSPLEQLVFVTSGRLYGKCIKVILPPSSPGNKKEEHDERSGRSRRRLRDGRASGEERRPNSEVMHVKGGRY